MSLSYRLNSGKNRKFSYYVKSFLMHLLPRCICNLIAPIRLRRLTEGQDLHYLDDRVNYYCKLDGTVKLPSNVGNLSSMKPCHPAVYYHDFYRTQRFFSGKSRCALLPGDIAYVPDYPMFVKSRPIDGDNRNSVVLKLNRLRHFIFVDDHISFEDKIDKAIFRGGVKQPQRRLFMEKFFDHPLVDAGEATRRPSGNPKEWQCKKMTLYNQLKYKFIMSIEGNDVASNLKWVMSSNSIAVMPKPTCETWFMEGRLIPDYHYIEVKPDFSDLEERLRYYIDHTDEAKQIIMHANEYVQQFKDTKREDLLEMLVVKKYIDLTN